MKRKSDQSSRSSMSIRTNNKNILNEETATYTTLVQREYDSTVDSDKDSHV
ncbi:unnamed protein product, partial [Rotaria sp. Silwood2]